MSTGESIVENYFSSYAAYDLDIDAPSWMNARVGISEDRGLAIVAFTDVNTVEWQVHDRKDDTTEMGTVLFHALAQLAHAEDEDKTVIATVEAPFQVGGRVELGGESFETEKPENFELV